MNGSTRVVVAAITGLALAGGVGIASGDRPRRADEQRRAGDLTAPGWHGDLQLEHDGGPRWFRIYVPRELRSPAPVVVLLHGGTQSMRKIFRPRSGGAQGWTDVADDEGFLLVVPNGVNADTGDPSGDDQNWNDCRGDISGSDTVADDVGFIAALLDWVEARYDVDTDRVYATGSSNGGQMSFRLAVELGHRLAAIAPFIANWAAVPECSAPWGPVPVQMVNGTADTYVPWNGGGLPGDRGTVVSVADTLSLWLEINDAGPVPVEERSFPDRDPFDGSTLHLQRFEGAAEVVLVTVEGGGHTMPSIAHPVPAWIRILLGLGAQNHDVEGSRLAWEFLSRHQRPDRR
jgi:polyhydroxybutyrate depolymerase